MRDELKKQFTLRITQANKIEMVVILYEMFMTYVQDAQADIADSDVKNFRINIQRARACLKELMGSLNLEYEPAPTVMKLYIYISKLLVMADLHNEKQPLEEANHLMKKLRDSYAILASQDTSGPVMGNAQTVYAGLTYSKNDLSVNLDDGQGKRGFFA